MKRFRYLLFSLLFVLLAVMPPVFAQEEATEEAVVEEAAVEEEAVWGDDAAAEVAPAETAKATGSGMTISAGYGIITKRARRKKSSSARENSASEAPPKTTRSWRTFSKSVTLITGIPERCTGSSRTSCHFPATSRMPRTIA